MMYIVHYAQQLAQISADSSSEEYELKRQIRRERKILDCWLVTPDVHLAIYMMSHQMSKGKIPGSCNTSMVTKVPT